MYNTMIFCTHKNRFEDLTNLFKALIKFGLKMSLHRYRFFRDELIPIGVMFILKDRKSSYTLGKEKCDVIINMNLSKSGSHLRHQELLITSLFLRIPTVNFDHKVIQVKWQQEMCISISMSSMGSQWITFKEITASSANL